jgi:hypothetical protein
MAVTYLTASLFLLGALGKNLLGKPLVAVDSSWVRFRARQVSHRCRQLVGKARASHREEGYPPRIRNSAATLHPDPVLRVGHEPPIRKPIAGLVLEILFEFGGCP